MLNELFGRRVSTKYVPRPPALEEKGQEVASLETTGVIEVRGHRKKVGETEDMFVKFSLRKRNQVCMYVTAQCNVKWVS